MKSRKQKNPKRKTFKKFSKSGKKNKTRVKRHMMIKKGGGKSGQNYYDTGLNSSFVDPNLKQEEESNKKKTPKSGIFDYIKSKIGNINGKKVSDLVEAIATNQSNEIITKLIDEGADVNSRNSNGQTPLILATWKNNTKLSVLLVEKGADVNARNNNGRTPLLWATYKNNTELSVLLVEKGADVNAKDNDGQTPLYWATKNNNTELSVLLVEKGAKVKSQWYHRCIPS